MQDGRRCFRRKYQIWCSSLFQGRLGPGQRALAALSLPLWTVHTLAELTEGSTDVLSLNATLESHVLPLTVYLETPPTQQPPAAGHERWSKLDS